MRQLMFILALLTPMGAAALDVQALNLQVTTEHVASKAWRGGFVGLNGRGYDTRRFFEPKNQLFSASTTFAIAPRNTLSVLVPVQIDAGYNAVLYKATPSASFGAGASWQINAHNLVSLIWYDALNLGGGVRERPCYDRFRRQYHCGTGQAWVDYQKDDRRQRTDLGAGGMVRLRVTSRF